MWDTASLTCVRVLEGHDGPALSVAVAGWGAKGPRIVASGGADKSIRIWDIQKDIRGRTGVGGNDAGNGCDDSEASVEHAPPKGDCDAGDGEEQRPTDTGAEDEAEQWDAAGELDGCGGEDAEGSPGRRANANADGGGGSADGNKQKRKGRKEKRGGKARGSGGAEGTAARERRTALREESLLKHVEDWAGMIGAQPRTLKAHSKGVVALTFSSDGLLLLSGGEEATVSPVAAARRPAPLVFRIPALMPPPAPLSRPLVVRLTCPGGLPRVCSSSSGGWSRSSPCACSKATATP